MGRDETTPWVIGDMEMIGDLSSGRSGGVGPTTIIFYSPIGFRSSIHGRKVLGE